jgi:hypothetical protein
VVRADEPWRGFRELLDHAKAAPGRVAYGSPGAATTPHVTMERIAGREGIAWVHVPYRGDAETLQALLNGDVQAAAAASTWAPLVEEGRLRLLCTWGAERARRFPGAPTLRELGIDVVATSPYGIAGPKGVEPGVVRVLHDAFREALFDPSHVALLERFDMQVAYLGGEDYAAAARRRGGASRRSGRWRSASACGRAERRRGAARCRPPRDPDARPPARSRYAGFTLAFRPARRGRAMARRPGHRSGPTAPRARLRGDLLPAARRCARCRRRCAVSGAITGAGNQPPNPRGSMGP